MGDQDIERLGPQRDNVLRYDFLSFEPVPARGEELFVDRVGTA
ncbi:hypothetical protein [Arthrobacter sp. ISL-65]|nr:hypothetical protein [Arthrobacter sp. ISL-65]